MDLATLDYIFNKLSIFSLTKTCSIRSFSYFSKSLFPIYKIDTSMGLFACKILDSETMARYEVSALKFLKEKNTYTPNCYGYCSYNSQFYILMDFIESAGPLTESSIYETLSSLYNNQSNRWGWESPTFIGAVYQENKNTHKNFTDFWWLERIEPLVRKCLKSQWFDQNLANEIESIIKKYSVEWSLEKVKPRLIHGDLWSGNIISSTDGKMYLIDPSISYGHPEQDIGMMKMFGGFSGKSWLDRLSKELNLEPNLEDRIPFWQIYPVLVHIILFGSSYIGSLNSIIRHYR